MKLKYKSRVVVGIDELTLVLTPEEKCDFTEWNNNAEIMLKTFLDLSQIEAMFGELVHAGYGVQQGYTDGLTFDNKPWHFSISWHEYLQNMGVCIKFSAHAWAVYQNTFSATYGADMNIAEFLRMVQSNIYKTRLSRIDMTADYFNFHKAFTPDILYKGLVNGNIGVKDYKNRSMQKVKSAVDRNGVISTVYLGSKKSNTRHFSRIYDKRLEQLQNKGFHYDEALLCKRWIRHEVVFKSDYAHQITEDLLSITTQTELQQYIAQKITEKYRFYDTATNKDMKYTRALLYIAGDDSFNHLSSPKTKDNDLMRSIEYLMKGSGLYPTLFKALEVWGDGADKELVNFLFEHYEKLYIEEAYKKKDLITWIKKHRSTLREQSLQEYLSKGA